MFVFTSLLSTGPSFYFSNTAPSSGTSSKYMLNLCMLYLLFWGKWHQSRQNACLCILLCKNELFYWAETLSRALSLNHIKTCSGFYLDTFAEYLNGTFCIKQCCEYRGGSRIELANLLPETGLWSIKELWQISSEFQLHWSTQTATPEI